MIARPSPRRFIAMMTACALTLTGVVITGIGGFPLLALASILVLLLVETSYHSFDRRHRAATVGVERSTLPYYDLDIG
jgi:hypothetical protein